MDDPYNADDAFWEGGAGETSNNNLPDTKDLWISGAQGVGERPELLQGSGIQKSLPKRTKDESAANDMAFYGIGVSSKNYGSVQDVRFPPIKR